MDRRLVHERDRCQIDQVQCVHKIPLHFAAVSDILRVIMEHSRHNGGRPSHLASGHRHRVVAVNVPGCYRHLVGDLAFRADELVVIARGVVGQLDGIVMLLDEWPLVTLLDPLGQERRVAFGQLLEALFSGPQIAVEPLPLPANRSPAFVCQVAFHLLPRPHDRLSNTHLDLSREPVTHGGIEVIGTIDHSLLQFLEVGPCLVGVGHHQVTGIAESHGGFLLQLLSPYLAHRVDIGQFVRAGIGGGIGGGIGEGRRQHVGRQCFGRRAGNPRSGNLLRDRADDCGSGVVGIAAEGCLRQAEGCVVGARSLSLSRERGERGGLATDGTAGQVEPLPAEQGQKGASCFPCIADQLLEVGMLFLGLHGWYVERNRRRRECGRAGVEQHLDGGRL